MRKLALALLFAAFSLAQGQTAKTTTPAPTPTPQLQDLYGAGAAFSPGSNQLYAATAFEAHHLTGDTYTFTDFVLVPTKVTTGTTTSTVFSKDIGVGAAVKLFDAGKYGFYTTGTGGPSWTGSDTTWQFNYGGTVPIRFRQTSFYIMPIVTGVSSGNGTSLMYEICIAWGK
ncbi:hypothetical protein KGP36_06065 [Patescibacteria group bacterium]|nr:hypothetical protein [Patescibacteria group bacterium]